ncbi:MAG: hypothetical protein K9L30_02910 [Desulfobacterales bacterium]|nr:hypothetical protein [Desulfobacterales bacterium]
MKPQINEMSLFLGLLVAGYGIVMFIIRQYFPQKSGKLNKMKQFYGDKKGYWLHLVSYTILPVVIGLFWILRGLKPVF